MEKPKRKQQQQPGRIKQRSKRKQRQRPTSKGAVEQGTPLPTMVKTTRKREHPRKRIMYTARTMDQQQQRKRLRPTSKGEAN